MSLEAIPGLFTAPSAKDVVGISWRYLPVRASINRTGSFSGGQPFLQALDPTFYVFLQGLGACKLEIKRCAAGHDKPKP